MARTIALTLVLVFVAGFVIALVVGAIVHERNHREEREAYYARRRAEWRDTRPGARHAFWTAMVFLLVGGLGALIPEEPTWWGWPLLLGGFSLMGLWAFLDRRPFQPPAPTDPESYRRMGIGDRADWAKDAGLLSPEMRDTVLADDRYVIAAFATNPDAPLHLMAAVPLQRHTAQSATAFFTRLGIVESHGDALSELLDAMDDDARPILEAVREELGIEVPLPTEGD